MQIDNQIKKVIIWGHKLYSHTHSFIHNGFFKTFKHLGYDTYWFDNNDNVNNFDFSCSLFLTEGQVDSKMPLRDDCYYILHNVDQEKYRNSTINKNKVLIIQVYTKDCLKRNELELEKCIHYTKSANEQSYSVLYFPWPTDLLPYEIEQNISNYDNVNVTQNIYFIGMGIYETNLVIDSFCKNNNLKYVQIGGFSNNVDTKTNQQYISESIIAPAIQGDKWQVDVGYVPCRIFKNISYGKMGITNNETVYELFEKKIIYDPNMYTSLEKGLQFEKNNKEYKKEKIIELMNLVKEKHTYINRIQLILKCLFENI
jgi:hypothetical protein